MTRLAQIIRYSCMFFSMSVVSLTSSNGSILLRECLMRVVPSYVYSFDMNRPSNSMFLTALQMSLI